MAQCTPKSFDLTGKVALITGASYGIGMAIAKAMAANGATIVFNDIKQELVDKGLASYAEAGIKAHGYVCDVTDEDAVNAMVAKITEEVGHINILVNNAGITRDGLMVRMKDDDFDRVIDVNLKGTFHICRAAGKIMMKQRYGRIVNMSSISGVGGNAGQANYAASKAGVIGLTKTIARELAARGVTANVVAPGFISTDMTDALSEKQRDAIGEQIPMKRFGTVDDVAHLVGFLASEESGYITGQVICIDGGLAL